MGNIPTGYWGVLDIDDASTGSQETFNMAGVPSGIQANERQYARMHFICMVYLPSSE